MYLTEFYPKLYWHSHPGQNAIVRARTPERGGIHAELSLFGHSSPQWKVLASQHACFLHRTSSFKSIGERRRKGVTRMYIHVLDQYSPCPIHHVTQPDSCIIPRTHVALINHKYLPDQVLFGEPVQIPNINTGANPVFPGNYKGLTISLSVSLPNHKNLKRREPFRVAELQGNYLLPS